MAIRDWTLDVDGVRTSIAVPTHLDDGRVPDRELTYRLFADVVVPPAMADRPLTLLVFSPGARMRLVADGVRHSSTHTEFGAGYRVRGPNVLPVPPSSIREGRVHLELEVDHRWTQSAWFDAVPLLTADPTPVVSDYDAINFVSAVAALIGLLQVGFTCLAVYLFDRRRRQYLFFACQACFVSFYPAHVSGLLPAVVGIYDTHLMVVTLVAALVASIYFTHSAFGLADPPRAVPGLVVGGVAIPVLWPGPFELTFWAGRVVVAIATSTIAYQPYRSIRLASTHSDRAGAISLAVAWLMLASMAWTDLARWVELPNHTNGIQLAPLGLLAFAFGLSALLMTRHTKSLKESEALNLALEARVAELEEHGREIESLNTELRRRINDRAAQLVDALALPGSSTNQRLTVGALIDDRYRVVAQLGAGGMGAVWEVVRLHDGRPFALKVAHELGAATTARLAREAHIASSVSHPNVVAVVDVDVDATRGLLFIVMELAKGTSLAAELPRRRGLRWGLRVLEQVAEGIAALHRHGIVHRDLTPANVLLIGDVTSPTVKVTDFGISRRAEQLGRGTVEERTGASHEDSARVETPSSSPLSAPPASSRASAGEILSIDSVAADDDPDTRLLSTGRARGEADHGPTSVSSRLTGTGLLAGTPLYIAPEIGLHHGEIIESPSDMFSFGVLAFQLFAERAPFVESVALATIEGRTLAPPPSIAALCRDLPAVAAEAIQRCVSLDPAHRPTADEASTVMRAARDALEAESGRELDRSSRAR